MEITVTNQQTLKIKEKSISFVFDPQDKSSYNAAFALQQPSSELSVGADTVIISGPGEYEIAGVKITGTRIGEECIYSMRLGMTSILVGKLSALDKAQQKQQEHNLVIAAANETANVSFLTSLATNAILFYGDKAEESAQTLSGESVKKTAKFTTTRDKLPQELETIVLE